MAADFVRHPGVAGIVFVDADTMQAGLGIGQQHAIAEAHVFKSIPAKSNDDAGR
jgi:hypothetical protein